MMTVRRTLKEFPGDSKLFLFRLCVLPFETALGISSIWSGIMAFFDATISARLFSDALSTPVVATFNLIHVVAGFAMVAGIGWAYRNLEVFGLILLVTSLFVRAIVLSLTVGWSPVTSAAIMQSVVFGMACIVKVVVLWRRYQVVLVDTTQSTTTTKEHQLVTA